MEPNNNCAHGAHECFEYVEVIPHIKNTARTHFCAKKCEHLFDCPYCCDQVELRPITQCLLCQKWWANDNRNPKELFKKQNPQEDQLTRACASNDRDKVTSLLNSGINPNTRRFGSRFDVEGKTPLFYTTDPDIVGILLAASADPNIASTSGATVLERWCSEEESESSLTIIKKLLAAGTNPDLHAHDRFTPLIVSFNNNSKAIPLLLLEAQANPNHQEPLNIINDPQQRNLLKKYGAIEKAKL